MNINERGIEIIKSFEGFSSEPYLCPANVWTVGYGATRSSTGGPINPDMEPISEIEAEALFLRDLESSQGWVSRLIKTALTENQFSALVSFTFNVGAGVLQRSTLRMKNLTLKSFKAHLTSFPVGQGRGQNIGWIGST